MRCAVALIVLLAGCAQPMPPPAVTPAPVAGPPKRDVGPLVPLGFGKLDYVGYVDSPVRSDGDPDFAFRVRISGEVSAFVLYGSDAAAKPLGGAVWDTMTAPSQFPPAWHMPCEARQSWALAVLDDQGTLLNPNVTLPRTTFRGDTLTVYAADQGHARFVSGHSYTLVVVRPDGTTDRSTTTLL